MVALKSPFLVAKDLFVLNRAIGGFPISFNDDMTKFKFPLYEWYRLGILFICLGMQYINIPLAQLSGYGKEMAFKSVLQASQSTPTDLASMMVLISSNLISRLMEFVFFWIKVDDMNEFVRAIKGLDMPKVEDNRIGFKVKRQLCSNLILIIVVATLMANYNRSLKSHMFGEETQGVIWLQVVWWFNDFLSLCALFFSPSAVAKDMLCILSVSSLLDIFDVWNARMNQLLHGPANMLFTLTNRIVNVENAKGESKKTRRLSWNAQEIKQELDTGLKLAKIIEIRNNFIGPFLLTKFVVNLINCVSSLYVSLSFFVKWDVNTSALLQYVANFMVFWINLGQIFFLCKESQALYDATQTSKDLIEHMQEQMCKNDQQNEPQEFKLKILQKKLNKQALLSPMEVFTIDNSTFPVACCGVVTYIIILYQLKLSGF